MSADNPIDFPGELHRALERLDPRPGLAFMAALCERLLPNHLLYAELTGDGDARGVRAVMDLIWESLTVREARIDFERQAEKLAACEPESTDDSFGTRSALEVTLALSSCLDVLRGSAVGAPVEVSRISIGGVERYIDMVEGAQWADDSEREARLAAHPLMADERAFQQAVFDELEAGALDRERLKALRRLGRNDGVSNLGLSLEE
ncbi:hypothetical protein C7446_3129 [Kushneria sinocarnis]|uniref:DUF416 family protein n=1 Tax=Kushneria sinocarnis TaxID=595502 RepID=A0A420WT08_9GAMM|nr:YjaG family protein [Kushneria sinocarnis]RKQ95754.1 hypothetical protein C7446_3129 [Kushneria sinocarnis]